MEGRKMPKTRKSRSKKSKRFPLWKFIKKVSNHVPNSKMDIWFRTGAFVVLFTLALYLVPPHVAKTIQQLPKDSGVKKTLFDFNSGIKKIPFDYKVGGVKAEWGYSAWTQGGQPGLPLQDKNIMGGDLNMNGTVFPQGIGTHSPSQISFDLQGKINRFSCLAGLDLNGKTSKGVFLSLQADGKEIFKSQKLDAAQNPLPIDVSVTGVKKLILVADPAGSDNFWTQVDWVNLKFTP
jgi:hypothetical protein